MSLTPPSAAMTTTGAARAAAVGPDPASELKEFLGELIETQCRLVGAIAGAVFLLGGGARAGGLMAQYNAPGTRPINLEKVGPRLEKIIESACRAAGGAGGPAGVVDVLRMPGEGALYGDEPAHPVLAAPLVAAGRVEGCALVILPESRTGKAPADAEDGLLRVGLAAARFETYLWREHAVAESQQKALLRQTLELLDASQQGASAKAMGGLLSHELARRFGCTRVSIGLIGRGDRLRVVAVSGTEQLKKTSAAAEALEAAMEECAAQDVEVLFPQGDSPEPADRRVTRAHDALSKKFGPSAIVSLPLRVEGDLVGVVVLEREAADPFPTGSLPLLRLVAEFIGPSLWTRRLADRGIFAVTRDQCRRLGAAVVGPRHTGAKLAALALLLAVLAAALVPIPSRVVSEATIEAEARRTITPPFAGYLDEVLVRPGDVVGQGDVLARMDVRAIELDRDEALARRQAMRTERDNAMARGEMEKVRAADAQIAEIDARLRLLGTRLGLATLTAPIDGRVSLGDQRDMVGSRIEATQPLFEIITEDRVVVLMVDERDITRVREGQAGWIAPRARPDQRASIAVVRINPVAQAEDRANVYRVEAEVQGEAPDWLRPGATAVARLEDGTTTPMALFLRPIVDKFRLSWWW